MKKHLIPFLFLLFTAFNSQGQSTLKILSYNIHHANPPSKANVIDLEAIAAVIINSKADIIGLQEVDVNVSRSEHIDQAKKLAELTGMRYYFFSKGIDLEKGEYGTAILSRYPIETTAHHLLPMPVNSEMRSLGIAKIKLPSNKTIYFANTHLDLKNENRIAQAQFIADHFKNKKDLVILVGDLNAKPDSQPIKTLESIFKRSSIPNGFTLPEVNPTEEIDFVMVNKRSNAKFGNHTVIDESYASDHRPLYVEIFLK